MRALRLTLLALLGAGGTASVSPAQDVKIDADTFGGIEARSIGPAAMGGRVSAIDASVSRRSTGWAC